MHDKGSVLLASLLPQLLPFHHFLLHFNLRCIFRLLFFAASLALGPVQQRAPEALHSQEKKQQRHTGSLSAPLPRLRPSAQVQRA